MHRRILAGALTLAAITPASALAAAQPTPGGPGVPAGQIEISQSTRTTSGTDAADPGTERTQSYLTADRARTVTRKADTGRLRAEGAYSPRIGKAFDAGENTITLFDGHPTPPYQSLGQQGRTFQGQIDRGCYRSTGSTIFRGRAADTYAYVKADSGPCFGEADYSNVVVDQRTRYVLQRTTGQNDGSFQQVDTLESFSTTKLTPFTKKLLRMSRHPGARVVDMRG